MLLLNIDRFKYIIPRSLRKHIKNMFLLGKFAYLKLFQKDPTGGGIFGKYLAIVAIAKNEGCYFQEWIEYHRLIGVEKFYIYDNESTDNTKEILQPYIDKGIVEYTYLSGEKMQLRAYMDTIRRRKNITKWLAIIDLDEFIVPMEHENIPAFLKDLERKRPDISQVVISWAIYGSANYKQKPKGLVIENFKCREKDSESSGRFKTIVNPRFVAAMNSCHYSEVLGSTVDENGNLFDKELLFRKIGAPKNKIRINHYITKSYEEFLQKASRGDAIIGRDSIRDINYFNTYNKNDVVDSVMDKYIEPLKKTISAMATESW